MHEIIVNSGTEESDLTYQAFMHYMEVRRTKRLLRSVLGSLIALVLTFPRPKMLRVVSESIL